MDAMNVEPFSVGGGGVGDNITVQLTKDQAALLLPVLKQLMPNGSPAAGPAMYCCSLKRLSDRLIQALSVAVAAAISPSRLL